MDEGKLHVKILCNNWQVTTRKLQRQLMAYDLLLSVDYKDVKNVMQTQL